MLPSIKKTDSLISKLKELADSGFSPSSLNRYIDNPINFFDEYVLDVKSNQEVNEFPESRGIGIIFHNTMEEIYKPFIGKMVDVKKLKISTTSFNDWEIISEISYDGEIIDSVSEENEPTGEEFKILMI